MLTTLEMSYLTIEELQEKHHAHPKDIEHLVKQSFYDDLLSYCHQLPSYHLDTDPFGLVDSAFQRFFDQLRNHDEFLPATILTNLKHSALQLVDMK